MKSLLKCVLVEIELRDLNPRPLTPQSVNLPTLPRAGLMGQSFLLCHQRNVANLSMLYKVNSYSNHRLFSELPSAYTRFRHTRAQLIDWTLKFKRVEQPNLQGVSCWPLFECGTTFPTLCLIPERWMGSMVQLTVGGFPELCFLQFFVAQMLVGVTKTTYKQLFFPNFIIIIIIIIYIKS